MKIYVHQKGIVLVGKAWEIRHKLLQYSKDYTLVKDWVENERKKK